MYISIQGVFRKQKAQEHSHLFTYSVCGHFSVVDTKASEFNITKKRFSSNWNYVKR